MVLSTLNFEHALSFLIFMFRVCHAFLSGYCSLVVTCWERAGLLGGPALHPTATVCDVLFLFCHFPVWCPGSGVVLDCIDS